MSRFSRLIEKKRKEKENIFQKLNFHIFQAFNFGPCLAITLRSSIRSISLSAPNSTRPLHRSHSLYGLDPYLSSAQFRSLRHGSSRAISSLFLSLSTFRVTLSKIPSCLVFDNSGKAN